MVVLVAATQIRMSDRRVSQGPEIISQDIPDWVLPKGTGSSARHQSRPDAVLCALSQAGLPTLILLRSLLKTGTCTLLHSNYAMTLTPFPVWKLLLPSMPAY
eukprot:1154067-Pelagomonas_calceolata.AAC.9